MTKLITFSFALCLVAASWRAPAQAPQGDAKAVWAKAGQAARNLRSIKYRMIKLTGKGEEYRATVYAQKADVPTPGPLSGIYCVLGETKDKRGGLETFAFSYDGKAFRYRGPEAKTVSVFESPSTSEIAMSVPFEQALTGVDMFAMTTREHTKLRYVERKTIEGHDCDVVEMTREVTDPLGEPRTFLNNIAFERQTGIFIQITSPGGQSTTVLSYEPNAKIDPAIFKLSGSEVKVDKVDALAKGLLPVGSKAPAFKVKDANGRSVSLSSLKGKLVLVDFWGTWCIPCVRAMPELNDLHQRYKSKGLTVISMAVAEKNGDPAKFMKKKGFDWICVPDGDLVGKTYRAHLLPTLYLIGKDGKILFRVSGLHESTKPTLDALIRKNLK